MIFIVTIAATIAATIVQVTGGGDLGGPISIPVSGIVAMCTMGVAARLIPARRAGLVAMLPRAIPFRQAVVWASGLAELAGGIGVLLEATRPWAGICLALLLICVFPANIVDAHRLGDRDGSFARRVLLRAAEQVVFIALCAWIVVASRG